jgi:outer membrane protein insertion porin family
VRWEAGSDGLVQIVAAIAPGRKMFIGHIAASGLSRTASRAFLRKFGIRSGKEFDATAMDAAERRLWFTGAFSGVDIKTTPQPDGTVDVDLTVEEGKARHLSTTVGYSQWDRAFLSATFVDRNVFGSLNRFSLEGFVSQRSYGGVATLADPWLFGQDLTGRVTAFALRRELPAFRAIQYGALLGLAGRDSDRNLTGWGIDYERRTTTDAVIFSGNESDALEDYTIGMLSFYQQLDRRNNVLAPMSGYNLRYDAGVASEALLGDVSFFRLTAQATWYLPLREILPERPFVPVVVLNHRAGVILPYSDTSEVPVPERFFLGGPDSVRSFQLDGMAPRDDEGVPTGGQAFFLANIELQWPIWQGIFVAVFTDVGNLAPDLDAMAWDQTRIAPGAGLRLYTPLGALRLDYGLNLVRHDGDPFGNWQFGVGFTF